MAKIGKKLNFKSTNIFLVAQTFIKEGKKIISEYENVENENAFSTAYNKELAWIDIFKDFLKKNVPKEVFKKFKLSCKEEGIWIKINKNPVKYDTKIRINNLNKKIEALKDLAEQIIINENDL